MLDNPLVLVKDMGSSTSMQAVRPSSSRADFCTLIYTFRPPLAFFSSHTLTAAREGILVASVFGRDEDASAMVLGQRDVDDCLLTFLTSLRGGG